MSMSLAPQLTSYHSRLIVFSDTKEGEAKGCRGGDGAPKNNFA